MAPQLRSDLYELPERQIFLIGLVGYGVDVLHERPPVIVIYGDILPENTGRSKMSAGSRQTKQSKIQKKIKNITGYLKNILVSSAYYKESR